MLEGRYSPAQEEPLSEPRQRLKAKEQPLSQYDKVTTSAPLLAAFSQFLLGDSKMLQSQMIRCRNPHLRVLCLRLSADILQRTITAATNVCSLMLLITT